MKVKQITYKEAVDFLLPRHYSGRKPQISKAFGLFVDEVLVAVCTFGKPASPSLCVGVCGKEYSHLVYELNRLCRVDEYSGQLSQFVSKCLKLMSPAIIVSFSDTQMTHHGYIYQACNFLYTGCTKERTDKWTPSGKHSRHYKNEEQTGFRKVRSAKHRYIYFSGNKKLKREWLNSLKYEIKPYPKGDNENYTLGEYIKERIVCK